jgi:hypothetical protein
MAETTKDLTFWERCGDTTPRDRRNLTRFVLAIAAWGIAFVAASWITKNGVVASGAMAWFVAAVPTAAALWVVQAYTHYLREADELQRATQLHALALGFGAGWIALTGYPLFERLGAPPIEASDYTVAMAAAFSIGCLVAWRRYR